MYCPKCKRTWPDKGRFCPMDGTPLVAESPVLDSEVETPKPAQSPVVAKSRPVEPVKTAPKPAEPPRRVEAKPTPAKAPEPRPAQEKSGPKRVNQPKKAPAPDAFSETKWFMKGELVKDDDLGPEVFTAKQLEDQYHKTTDLPEEIRKKYSLRFNQDKDKKSDS